MRPSPAIPAGIAAAIAAPPAVANGTAAAAVAGKGSCAACRGTGAPTFRQALSTVINHRFNSTFDVLSTLPGGPISDLLTGALALVRRTLFFVPEGVTASQTANGLSIAVNTGSVAYFRQDGTFVQVSGDPLFLGAKPFTLTADQTVAVTNPGNAGCAGFVFTSGTAKGSLATSQIDAIRFEGDSAFDGSVGATVAGHPLTLRDAVRGGNGVTIDAAVVLANDVEIDAGGPGAHVTGAVDGTKKGKQSLKVTALATTVFDAPIGGTTPLAGLLTQGIEPLVIAKSGDTKTIPLHFLPELSIAPPTDASPGVKYGIDVAIGDNPSQVYEFDTGGTGLFAGYNQPLWVGVPLTTTPASEVYNSGNYFDGVVSNTRVTLGRGDQTVSTAQPIAIGAILAGGNSKTNKTFTFTDPAAPPVEGRFFGDFGASFNVNNGLTSPLVQLPGNLANGFVVQLGPIGVTPQLTVGITEALRKQFPYAVPVIVSPKGGTYPTSGLAILDQFGFAPTYTVTQGTESHVLGNPSEPPVNITCQTSEPCLPTLIDSGAPASGIRLGEGSTAYFATKNGEQLQPGTTFKATFPTTPDRPIPLIWQFTAGDISSVDLVTYEKTQKVNNPENVNGALTLYNSFDVMFDVAGQKIYLRPTGGQATVTLSSVATTGSQTYRQNAVLAGDYTTEGGAFSVAGVTTLDGDTSVGTKGGDVTFSGTVDGASTLTVNSSGATNFVRVVGSQTPLASLTTDAGGSTTTAGASTSGDQTYGDAVSLSGVFSVEQGTFSVAGTSTLAGPAAVSGGDILFGGSIDSAAGKGYQLGLTPGDRKTANLDGAIGKINPLGGMQLSATDSGSATVNVNNSLALLGNLGYSAETGIKIGNGVSASFTGGALIQSFTGAAVIVDGAAPLTISEFRLAGNGKEGIQVKDTSAVNIIGNVIVGNGTSGISLDTVKGAVIGSNTISNNGADGILLKDSKNVTVTANT
ncbi:MAG: right-handed parallel beta-helix repeat-containing protein, partial [Mycobacterium sp.]